MGFFEELRERTICKLLIRDGYDPVEDADMFEPPPDGWKNEVDEVDTTIEALIEMIMWHADFEGYIDIERRVIDGHLSNWIGGGVKPTCRLIGIRKEGE